MGSRNYRLFLLVQVTGGIGVSMQRLAQDWLILQLTGSPAAVGLAVALQFLPMLVVGPLSGLVVDMFPKRRIMLVCQVIAGALALTLAIWAGTGTIPVLAVYASCVILGLSSAIDSPTRQVFVNEVVGDARLRQAIGLNNAIIQLGAMAGPALGGVLIALYGSAAAFASNAALCVLVLVLILAIRTDQLHHSPAAVRGRGQVLAGFRYVRDRPRLLLIILLAGLLGAFGMNGPVVLAAFADQVWHNGAAGFGIFNTLSACGALAGALVAARLHSSGRKTIVVAAALFGLSQLVAALMPTVESFMVLLVVVGMMTLVFLTAAATTVQLETGPEIRGRVMALYLPLLMGGHALGGLLAGWLTEAFGVREGLVTTGALGILSAAAVGLLLWRNGQNAKIGQSK
ncbi:MFS transporter [Pseudarthrobacter sp. J75]|uniref:MFS transporter n=1 Tax=unclassified Pseudarthrobacter TaxID=2647000 RepID=UPI002E820029|nr:MULTISPECIES: MFS transporter [unclassified Pseudarthrobacter]MEE2522224.1 MFS transporter [Pseudarthrobacter sp. J47]MEE2528130.1 MFS transporter [Pseudarthrobacter sp. J75]